MICRLWELTALLDFSTAVMNTVYSKVLEYLSKLSAEDTKVFQVLFTEISSTVITTVVQDGMVSLYPMYFKSEKWVKNIPFAKASPSDIVSFVTDVIADPIPAFKLNMNGTMDEIPRQPSYMRNVAATEVVQTCTGRGGSYGRG